MRVRFSHTRAGIVHVFVRCKELILLERWREILGKEREARELENDRGGARRERARRESRVRVPGHRGEEESRARGSERAVRDVGGGPGGVGRDARGRTRVDGVDGRERMDVLDESSVAVRRGRIGIFLGGV